MTRTEALKALDTALWRARAAATPTSILHIQVGHAIDALSQLKTALAQPEQEPVAYLCENAVGHKYFRWKKPSSTYKPIALYTTPPQRKPLTDEQIDGIASKFYPRSYGLDEFARAIEAAHGITGEKNGTR